MSPEITTSQLIEENASLARKRGKVPLETYSPSSVSGYLAVVTQPGHERFGLIARIESCQPSGYEIRFSDGRNFLLPYEALTLLDKTLLAEEDKEQIAAMWTGERVILPCDIVKERVRHYLTVKYVDGREVDGPSSQTRAHELYCADKVCARLFQLLSLDDTLKAGHYLEGCEDYIVGKIKKEFDIPKSRGIVEETLQK